jgi:hypothetical protein
MKFLCNFSESKIDTNHHVPERNDPFPLQYSPILLAVFYRLTNVVFSSPLGRSFSSKPLCPTPFTERVHKNKMPNDPASVPLFYGWYFPCFPSLMRKSENQIMTDSSVTNFFCPFRHFFSLFQKTEFY